MKSIALSGLLMTFVLANPLPADETAGQIREALERAKRSLVTVSCSVTPEGRRERQIEGLAAVVGEGNLVLTTNRVISDEIPIESYRDFKIIVRREGELQSYKAEYLGKDDTAEVAFLRTVDPQAPTLPVLAFAQDASLEVGQPLVTFGQLAASDGYKRTARLVRVAACLEEPYRFFLPDATLGQQGSPVMTLDGRVIGIVGTYELDRGGATGGRNFQTVPVIWPSERFIEVVASPPEGGRRVRRPWLGIADMEPLAPELAEYYGLGERKGIVLRKLVDAGPAASAGLKPEDILLAVNGKNFTETRGQLVRSLRSDVKNMNVGDEVVFDVFRELETMKIAVPLQAQPLSEGEASRYQNERIGLTVRDLVLTDTLPRELPWKATGVIVERVKASSPAAAAGLRRGDILKRLQGRDVEDVSQFKAALEAEMGKNAEELGVFRLRGKENTSTVQIKLQQEAETPAEEDSGETQGNEQSEGKE